MATWKDRHKLVVAVYVVVADGEKILMMRRHNTGYMDGKYSLPAGHLDGGESATTAASRELQEELGIKTKSKDLMFLAVDHRLDQQSGHERVHFFFEIKQWQGDPVNTEPEKCDDIAWFDRNKLPSNIAPEVKVVLEKIDSGQTYCETNFN